MELFQVVSVDEAKAIIDSSFGILCKSERVHIFGSAGKTCFQDIKSPCNIPQFCRSAVDGYAVNSKDVFGASESLPTILRCVGEVSMGNPPESGLVSGECMYVPTGGMLPQGADSVVLVEYSGHLDEYTVLIYSPAAVGEHVIQVGEDIGIQDIILKRGERIRPYEMGVLASTGIFDIPVYRKMRVGIISTGDELVARESEPKLGEIRDINTYLLWSLLCRDGMNPVSYGIVKDDYQVLKDTVDLAFDECDMVLISGGSSVGKKDQTLKVINSYQDGRVLVHGIAVKPGKPTIIGKHQSKIIFGLPGHPLACAVIYNILVKYYIEHTMQCHQKEYGVNAYLSTNYHKAKGREEYLPVTLKEMDKQLIAAPVFGKSALISVFSKAYGYIKIDKDIEGLKKDQPVLVFKL